MIPKAETTELLRQLVAIPSEYFAEEAIMDFARRWLEEQGVHGEIFSYEERKVTGFRGQDVLAEVEGGGEGPTICLNGHLDTVKRCSGWTKDPLGEQEGDRFYGVGALDMKSGCAALMVALVHFHRDHPRFNGRIKLSLVSVEEGPYGLGTNALIEAGRLDDVDFSIITEPSAGFTGRPFPDLCLGARGGYGLQVAFYGKSAHAASPEKGCSALVDAAKVVAELEHIEYVEDPHLGKGSCCVVEMHADGGACSVPDYAVIKLFRHIVPGEGPDTIVREIDEAVRRANIRSRYEIRFREAPSEDSRGFLPYTVDREEPMVRAFMAAVEHVTGREPSISYFDSIGDFCYLGTRLKAPAVIFGADGRNYHSKDEYVLLDSVHQTAQVVYRFLEQVLLG